LSPKSRTQIKNKISSGEGLEMLKKWHTDNTVLWFVSFEMLDFIPSSDVRVTLASPTRVEITEEGNGKSVSFDPREIDFWLLDASDVPLRDIDVAPFARFLGMRRRGDNAPTLLAERASVQ
jgi:hypothetical protein